MREPDFELSADMRLLELQRSALGLPPRERHSWESRTGAEGSLPVAQAEPEPGRTPVLAVEAVAFPADGVIAGAVVTLTLSVANEGAALADDVVVAAPLPGGASYRPGTFVWNGRSTYDEVAEKFFHAGLPIGALTVGERATFQWKIGVRLGAKPLVIAPQVRSPNAAVLGGRPVVIGRKGQAATAFAGEVGRADTAVYEAKPLIPVDIPATELPIYELDEEEQLVYEAADAALSSAAPKPEAKAEEAIRPSTAPSGGAQDDTVEAKQIAPVEPEAQPVPAEAQPVPVEAQPVPVEAQPAPVEAQAPPVEVQPVEAEAQPVQAEAQPVPVEVVAAPVAPTIIESPREAVVLYGGFDRTTIAFFERVFEGSRPPAILQHCIFGGALACTLDVRGADEAGLKRHLDAQSAILHRIVLHEKLGKKEPISEYAGELLANLERLQPAPVEAPQAPGGKDRLILVSELSEPTRNVLSRISDERARWDFVKARQLTLALQAQSIGGDVDASLRARIENLLHVYAQASVTVLQKLFVRIRIDRTTGLLFQSEPALDAAAKDVIAALKTALA